MLALSAGCATRSAPTSAEPARLSFATQGTVKGFPGSFRTLDGKPIKDTPAAIEISAGRHTIGYWCPNHLVLDGPPSISATFKAGRNYVLHCQANQPGRVEEQ